MIKDLSREQNVILTMHVRGVDRATAESIYAIESGESDGDVAVVPDTAEASGQGAQDLAEARATGGEPDGNAIAQSLADWLWGDEETLRKRIENAGNKDPHA